jgi:hypothetical protein
MALPWGLRALLKTGQEFTLESCAKIRVYNCACRNKNWSVYVKLLDAVVSFHYVLFVCDYFFKYNRRTFEGRRMKKETMLKPGAKIRYCCSINLEIVFTTAARRIAFRSILALM